MTKYFLKFILYTALVSLVANCTVVKKSKAVTDLSKENFTDDTATYKMVNKADRKTFFKDSPAETFWVDSIYNKMSLQEKLGQLFMIAAYSNKDSVHINNTKSLIQDYNIGSLIFFQGGPVRQARLTNEYQAVAKVPLFVAVDAEWGLSMRLDSTYVFPWNMTLGAIQDLDLIEKVGQQMGAESKRMGIHFNFSPVIDINTNPKNPIIGNRSFGESKINVSNKAIALMKGVQNQGVFSTGKHFPGHGDTSTDSHYTLPLVHFSKERLNMVEFYPYKRMFDEGLSSVMVGHLNIPSLESKENYPSSASYNVVTDVLQTQLGFEGLIFTDGLAMKGATNFKSAGDLELAVLLAGNDILLAPENVPASFEKLLSFYKEGILTEERLAFSVKKILKYKFKVGLNKYHPVAIANLITDINPSQNEAIHYKLYENAITVLKNTEEILPIKDVSQKIAYVKLGDDENSTFISTLKKYTEVTEVSNANIDSLNAELKKYDIVILSFHKENKTWAKQDFSEIELQWVQKIAKENKVILDIFTKPYTLLSIDNFEDIEGLVVSYQNSNVSQVVSAELLFGAIEAKGKLPVSINNSFKVNDGLTTIKLNRLGFTTPENEDMNSLILSKIDSIAHKAINGKMTPGMQVLVARRGNVIFQKSYGHLTYNTIKKVTNSDLYDVASISKMISTLPNLMQLYDQQKVKLDTKLKNMVPLFAETNKENITFKDLLTHYAGLQAFLPFYKATLNSDNTPMEKYYRKAPNLQFSTKVADALYIRNDYHDTIMKIIANSRLSLKKEYKYSDFTFIILKEFLEKTTSQPLEILSQKNFYNSLGMNNTMYNPLDKFDKNIIAPSEIDTYFRKQVVQGYVHDMAAAMEGGVAGHAGIFSNAMDVAKMMQLFLQKGNYGGKSYFSEQTFHVFNTSHYAAEGVQRGLGFDKRVKKNGPTCGCVSETSFGHTGFTGNIAWVDPKTEIVYVFLSNRTYPGVTAEGNKLSRENIREDIQQIIQNAIIK